ncbi:MAG TPA: 3-hydroxyacyl-CoA dehydrogenase family protein, partial [Anaerolineales bacterium]
EGVASHEQIDTIIENGGGFRMGPFRLMDLIGIDVNYTATKSIYEQTFHEPRYRPHLIQDQMVGQKALGKKTGRGFYQYEGEESARKPDGSPGAVQKDWEVYFTPGTWAPNLVEKCRQAGFKIALPAGGHPQKGSAGSRIGIVIAGTSENLHEHLQAMDQSLPPEVPLLCQGADVTFSQLAPALVRPERFATFDGLFMHYGKSVTLVGGPFLREDIRTEVRSFFHDLDYSTVWINESPGLVLPRTVCALVNEAAFAAGEGVAEPDTIDTAMKLGTNYPRGPIEWGRQIGFDKVVQVLEHLRSEYGEERYRVAPLLRRWSRLGRRSKENR